MSANAYFMQTVCADFVQTWNDFQKKVRIESAYAHFVQTCDIYYADFMHTI